MAKQKKVIFKTIKMLYSWLPLAVVCTGSVVAGLPLLHPGFPPTHDGEYHVIRFYEFYRSLAAGDVYPRWAADLNNTYGVPLFNYVYPLPNYIAAFFHTLGISFIDAFKLSLFLATILGAVFFYLWISRFFSNTAAMTAAIFYTFTPYRFVDIYVRGSVGEIWALAFFPAFLWAITVYITGRKSKYFFWASIFLALTIFSHNILALMFFSFSFIYVLVVCLTNKKYRLQGKTLISSLTIFLFGITLSAIFWLPALVETNLVRGLQIYDVRQNFPELYQLLIPSWGTGFSTDTVTDNQMSFQIGVANLIIIFLSICRYFFIRRQKVQITILVAFFLLSFLLVCFLMLPFSYTIWKYVPLLQFFQFPWRLLSLVLLISAFLAGFVVSGVRSLKSKILLSSFLVGISVLTTINYTKPAYYHMRTDSYYVSADNFIHGTNSPGNNFNTIWFNSSLPLPKQHFFLVENVGRIIIKKEQPTTYSLSAEVSGTPNLVANIAYFPGWVAYANQHEVPLHRMKDGRMSIPLKKGKHEIELTFNDTIIRKVALWMSFLTLVILLYIRCRKKNTI